jgi:hypothetical protein
MRKPSPTKKTKYICVLSLSTDGQLKENYGTSFGTKNNERFIHNYTLYILNFWVGWTVKLGLIADIKRD